MGRLVRSSGTPSLRIWNWIVTSLLPPSTETSPISYVMCRSSSGSCGLLGVMFVVAWIAMTGYSSPTPWQSVQASLSFNIGPEWVFVANTLWQPSHAAMFGSMNQFSA